MPKDRKKQRYNRRIKEGMVHKGDFHDPEKDPTAKTAINNIQKEKFIKSKKELE